MISIRDVFGKPFKHFNPWFTLYFTTGMLTFVPGTLVWALTLGMFRYFHLMDMLCTYCVAKEWANGYYP